MTVYMRDANAFVKNSFTVLVPQLRESSISNLFGRRNENTGSISTAMTSSVLSKYPICFGGTISGPVRTYWVKYKNRIVIKISRGHDLR